MDKRVHVTRHPVMISPEFLMTREEFLVSTKAVPGAVKANKDELAMGSWAEHKDGSLIFVKGVEGGSVVYSMYDVAPDPPTEYTDAMSQKGFEDQFTFDAKKRKKAEGTEDIEWTWHDKTAFPWERIMELFPAGQREVNANAIISAAKRVAKSLNLRGNKLEGMENLSTQELADKLRNALAALEA